MLCYVMLWYVMVCYGMLCYVMLWYVMVCYGMLWYVMVCMYLFKYLFIYLFITFGISCRMANTNVCNVLELSWIILSIFACSWAHLLGRQCKLISVDVTFLVIKPHWVWPLYHGNGKNTWPEHRCQLSRASIPMLVRNLERCNVAEFRAAELSEHTILPKRSKWQTQFQHLEHFDPYQQVIKLDKARSNSFVMNYFNGRDNWYL